MVILFGLNGRNIFLRRGGFPADFRPISCEEMGKAHRWCACCGWLKVEPREGAKYYPFSISQVNSGKALSQVRCMACVSKGNKVPVPPKTPRGALTDPQVRSWRGCRTM